MVPAATKLAELGFAMLLAWFLCADTTLAAERKVGAQLHCLSLSTARAETDMFGTKYGLQLMAFFNSPSPGEIRPPQGATSDPVKLTGFYRLSQLDRTPPLDQQGHIELGLPTPADLNENGVNDFFEIAMNVSPVQTAGTFLDPRRGEVRLLSTWSRPSPSDTGVVEIQMVSSSLQLTITFRVSFRLFQYAGHFAYSPGRNQGVLTLIQQPAARRTLEGTAMLGRTAEGELALLPFRLTGEFGIALTQGSVEPLAPTVAGYSAPVRFVDGDPFSTPEETDYNFWRLTIADPQLESVLGVPRPPRLGARWLGSQLALTIVQGTRAGYIIERSTGPSGSWAPWRTLPLADELEYTVTIPLPSDEVGLLRLSTR